MEIEDDVAQEIIELIEDGMKAHDWLMIEEALELLKQIDVPTEFDED
jgi:hypothetical protein